MTSPEKPRYFLHAMSELAPTLRGLGFKLAAERYDHAAFGSAVAEYRRRNSRLRLVWDGRDEALLAQVAGADVDDWSDVEAPRGVAATTDRAVDEARLIRLCDAIVKRTRGGGPPHDADAAARTSRPRR